MNLNIEAYNFIEGIGFWQFFTLSVFIGTFLGSFSNVVVHRLPIMMEKEFKDICEIELGIKEEPSNEVYNLSLPRSTCPKCNTPIKWYDNIPVISWLFLGGKCRKCKNKISIVYPLVELFAGLSFGLFSYLLFPSPLAVILPSVILVATILMFIDLKHMLLPDVITISLLWVALILSTLGMLPITIEESIMGAVFGYSFLWLVSRIVYLWKGVEGLGFGDIKYIAAVGAWTGPETLLYVIIGICTLAILLFGLVFVLDKTLDKNESYREYKELEANTKKDLGMKEDMDHKRMMPLGISISIVFIIWIMINFL